MDCFPGGTPRSPTVVWARLTVRREPQRSAKSAPEALPSDDLIVMSSTEARRIEQRSFCVRDTACLVLNLFLLCHILE